MKEIGGYFGLEVFTGEEYHKDLIALNSGRNALAYLIKARNVRKLWIPYFLCDSVSGVCVREACDLGYYHIDKNFMPCFDEQLQPDEWLYIVNFYGQISNKQVSQMKSRWGNIIFDNVQAFFQKPIEGVDTIYSCRKFFGVPDGAYLATDAPKVPLMQDISKDRMKHVLGRFEGVASDYYRDFKENDHNFIDLEARTMSNLTHNLLRAVDYDAVCQQRNDNFAYLHSILGDRNQLKLAVPNGPYMYPFYCANGMEIKRRLAEKKIYVATLWPNVLDLEGSLEKDYAQNILPLPCDQRYNEEDMERIMRAILNHI